MIEQTYDWFCDLEISEGGKTYSLPREYAPGNLEEQQVQAYFDARADYLWGVAQRKGRPPDILQNIPLRRLIKAILLVILDEINVLRQALEFQPRTIAQFRQPENTAATENGLHYYYFYFRPLNMSGSASENLSMPEFSSQYFVQSGTHTNFTLPDIQYHEEKYGFAPYGQFYGHLDNAGERIVMLTGLGLEIDNVRYNDKSPWPIIDVQHVGSIELIDDNMDNSLAQSWQFSTGTPTNGTVIQNIDQLSSLTKSPSNDSVISLPSSS